MHNDVETIEKMAFWTCNSLEALFLPSSITKIEEQAFTYCRNIRILPLPLGIDINQIGDGDHRIMEEGCDTFSRITQIQTYNTWRNGNYRNITNQVHQALRDFYTNLHPWYKACLDTIISAQTIQECIRTHGIAAAYTTDYDGMTPLHILALNPHATTGCLLACFEANQRAAFVRDGRDKTPLDTLLEYGDLDSYSGIVTALCMRRMSMNGWARKRQRVG